MNKILDRLRQRFPTLTIVFHTKDKYWDKDEVCIYSHDTAPEEHAVPIGWGNTLEDALYLADRFRR